MKVLVVCGSLRAKSLTRKLSDIAYSYARGKYSVSYLDLGKTKIEQFAGYSDEFKYQKTTLDAVKLAESADVFILAVPVYDSMLSSGIKNLFEHLDYKAMEGKTAGFIIKSGNAPSFRLVRSQLTDLMSYFNILSNPRAVFAEDTDFDEAGALKKPEIAKRIERLVDDTIALKKT